MNIDEIIDAHLAAYGEPDDARRAGLVKELWAADGSLIDPPFDGTGHEAIAGLGAILQQHYAGHTFRRTTAVDAPHLSLITMARPGRFLNSRLNNRSDLPFRTCLSEFGLTDQGR